MIGGRYRLESLLGRGAMAEVWRAEHVTLGTAVAVKLVSPGGAGSGGPASSDQTLERFLQEARAAARLRSPFVVHIYDHGCEGDRGYIAMELLEGESLRHRLDRLGRLAPLEVARVLSQLAAGLGLAHAAGVVHRDLKPENVFIASVHGQEVVKILDFGIAKRIDLGALDRLASHESVIIGTPCYMSPEQITDAHEVDARSDLWQLGVVAYECLCGRRPFDAPAAGELMVNICSKPPPVPSTVVPVPEGFDGWFATAVALAPDDRFQSAAELAETLCAVLAPETTASTLAGNVALGIPTAMQSSPGMLEQSGVIAARSSARSGQSGRAGPRSLLISVVSLAAIVALAGILVGSWVLSATSPKPIGAREVPRAPPATSASSEPEPADAVSSTSVPTAVTALRPTSPSAEAPSSTPIRAPAGGQKPKHPEQVAPGGTPTTTSADGNRGKARPEEILGI